MQSVMCLDRWTGLSLKLQTYTLNGWWGITYMTLCAITVRCRMAVRRWFRKKHRPTGDVQRWTVTFVVGRTVTVLISRTFRDVGGQSQPRLWYGWRQRPLWLKGVYRQEGLQLARDGKEFYVAAAQLLWHGVI